MRQQTLRQFEVVTLTAALQLDAQERHPLRADVLHARVEAVSYSTQRWWVRPPEVPNLGWRIIDEQVDQFAHHRRTTVFTNELVEPCQIE